MCSIKNVLKVLVLLFEFQIGKQNTGFWRIFSGKTVLNFKTLFLSLQEGGHNFRIIEKTKGKSFCQVSRKMKYVQLMQVCRKGESWENRKTVKCILNTVVWNKNKQKWVIGSGRQNEARKRFFRVLFVAAYLWWHEHVLYFLNPFFKGIPQASILPLISAILGNVEFSELRSKIRKPRCSSEAPWKKTILWDLQGGFPARTSVKKWLDTVINKIQLVVFENKEFDYQEKLKIFSLAGSLSPWIYQFRKCFREI